MSQKNILLTGATGYIGQRLLPELIDKGYIVHSLVRDKRRYDVPDDLRDYVKVYEADLMDVDSLKVLPTEVDAAYYLVHSMSNSYKDFKELELKCAENFKEYIKKTQCKQIVYLSGISNENELSRHFESRKMVEEKLRESGVPLTVLRAAIIVGSGSASFELIRDLVEKLPVMIAPKWLRNKVQPIAIRDVLTYLTEILWKEESYNKVFDIGGPDVLTYREMLKRFARVRGYRRFIIDVPVLTPKLSSYWLYFVTSTSFSLARSLVESLKHNVVVQKTGIKEIVKTEEIPYTRAVELAFDRIKQNLVRSSWTDSLTRGTMREDFLDFIEVPEYGCFKDKRKVYFDHEPSKVKSKLWSIGGKRGWYFLTWLWKIRGLLDKVVGGVGLRRGRRSPTDLKQGDALDFWRVLVADEKKHKLLLYAEMKLPGEAWLEFNIKKDNKGHYLRQIATFRPWGIMGRLYWYSVMPFHFFVFEGMARAIAKGDKN